MTAYPFNQLGILAGRGRYPFLTARSARQRGISKIAIAAIHGDGDPELSAVGDTIDWMYAGQLNKAIQCFKHQDVRHVIFAGQIKPARLFDGLRPDWRALKMLTAIEERNAESIFSAVADEFRKDGITILPATTFIEDHLATTGTMGKIKLARKHAVDVDLGRNVAREISRLNIGQTVVVKKGTVLAVEGFEGTDKAIARGGELGKGDVVVVKVAKPRQDVRFDVPCIGPRTIASLVEANAKVIAVQSNQTLLLDKPAVIAALDAARIAVVGIDIAD